MKISKEIKTGVIAIVAIGLLIAGVNFLKGNSFFGGDDIYYATFANSGGVTAATSVNVNGVNVGKVLDVQWRNTGDPSTTVLMKFNIQESNFKIPKDVILHAGGIDLLTKGLIVEPGEDLSKGYYKPGDTIIGIVDVEITSQIKSYADPLVAKVQTALGSIDKMVNSLSAFWDSTATSELEGSFKELQVAIHKIANVAGQVEELVDSEKAKLSMILANVESITRNVKKSNEQISAVIGNAEKITEDLVTADFAGTIDEAKQTLAKFNSTLEEINSGEGSLGKLISDDQLYNELNKTNQSLQNLVNDIQVHPERYIHVSVFGAKTKGVPLSPDEEKKLKKILDTIN